jgi:uncharacterized membrane protein YukC
MSQERKQVLIILAVVVIIIVAYILSGIFLQPQQKKIDDSQRQPVNRLKEIREGLLDK